MKKERRRVEDAEYFTERYEYYSGSLEMMEDGFLKKIWYTSCNKKPLS